MTTNATLPALPRRAVGLLLDGWPLLLAAVLLGPLWWHQGYPLARDLVAVPSQPFTAATWGLSGSAPRAVPLDAVMAMLTSVIDGAVVIRVALLLVLASAGWGARRLLEDLLPQPPIAAGLAVAGFAVWNPYVVERLALGQWALLAGYAALPWLIRGLRALAGGAGNPWSLLLWLALASLTPTGGLLAGGTLVVLGFRAVPIARFGLLVAGWAALQMPWLMAALTGPALTTSDPSGVAAFAARTDGAGTAWLSLLGLAGIWDAASVPATRETLLALAAVVVTVVAWVAGVSRLAMRGRLALLGVVGFALAVASSWSPAAVGALIDVVPGAGLWRDAQKWLAPFVVVTVTGLGVAVAHVLTARRWVAEVRWSLILLAVVVPVALLPDATVTTWRTVTPVRYPAGLHQVAEAIAAGPESTTVVALPWRSYRSFAWGSGLSSSDPAARILARDLVAPDVLVVGETTITGEDPVAAEIGTRLATEPPGRVLPGYGVGWVVVYRDDPLAATIDLTDLTEVYLDSQLALYATAEPARPAPVDPVRRTMVIGSHAVALIFVVTAAIAAGRNHRRQRRRERRS